MTDRMMPGDGMLSVSFGGHSMFLKDTLPIEVRDAANALVARRFGRFQRPLPQGVYLLRATLPDGSPYEEAVAVRPGETVERVLGGAAIEPPVTRGTSELSAQDLWGTSPGDSYGSARLVELHGCLLYHDEGNSWTFVPAEGVVDAPYAVIDLDDRMVSVSLPVSPGARFPENACVAAAVTEHERDHVVVRFTQQRRVATAVQGLIGGDSYLTATDLIDQATQLLYDKYRDPPAAALGALTLHRLGKLDARSSWVQNLASSFPWLTDGRVLLAAILCRRGAPEDRARALDLLLDASTRRMMFTDGFALLLDLLRRWPDGNRAKEREAALDRVLASVGAVDWDPFCLTLDADPA